MQLTRKKEDINAINYDLFVRSGISFKFKVKLYNENGYTGQNKYMYSEYLTSGNNMSVTLSPRSYIQISISDLQDNKNAFFLSEMYKNRFVKKISKLAALLDAYDDKEIDIVKVDQSGTHISNNFPIKEQINLGSDKATVEVIIREETIDVGVKITINDQCAVISANDFVRLYYVLLGVNYTQFTMQIISYIGIPDIGNNTTDLRPFSNAPQSAFTQVRPMVPASTSTMTNELGNNTVVNKYKPRW